MRVIVCGGEDLTDKNFVYSTLDKLCADHHISTIITGGNKGADFWAHMWATHNKKSVTIFPIEWKNVSRTILEALNVDILIAFESEDTQHIKKVAKKVNIPVMEIN